MINVLFLDDMEWRHSEFSKVVDHLPDVFISRVFTAGAAIDLLSSEPFDQVFLDHDLCAQDVMMAPGAPSVVPTGMDVVDAILAMPRPPTQVVVHSCNGPAAARMVERLETHPAGIWVRRIPFPTLLDRMHQMLNTGSMR